jgi:hypothetical protein
VRSTLDRLQRSEELAPDDPALAELKGSVLSKIAELEVAKAPEPPAPPRRILWLLRKPKRAQTDAEAESPDGPAPAHLQPDAAK